MSFVIKLTVAYGVPPIEEALWDGTSWVRIPEHGEYVVKPELYSSRGEAEARANDLRASLTIELNSTDTISVVEQN